MDYSKLSSYQDPQGTLKERKDLPPRTDMRKAILEPHLGIVSGKSVLDIGCNNGYFVREALKHGARRAVGVDYSDCIAGAREYARELGYSQAEFWQTNIESKEFKLFCPKFDVVFLLSVLTHIKNREGFLDWLDGIVRYAVIFESNHGEKNKAHIDLLQKHIWFESIEFLGRSDIESKPHYLWICRKWNHEQRYTQLQTIEIEFIPIDKIVGWDKKFRPKQKGDYSIGSLKFKELLEDIKVRGMRDPIILEDEKDGAFQGFQGSHRYLAAKILGYKDVPCKVLRGEVFYHLHKELK